MRRGFKAEARRLAVELREEVGLGLQARFDPYALAELYGVDVVRLSELDCSAEALHHFSSVRSEAFSGAVLPIGTVIVMLENDGHTTVRRRSTASHEMAHVVLEHPFAATMMSDDGCRSSNSEHEVEANWLAGELLIPTEAARTLGVRGVSNEDAATRFDVSVEMARWRLNVSGGRTIRRRVSR
ncbi:hypothetical protein ROP_pROB01-05720 (plasmid) [Rhodococcus opacus B4]|uniref:IrrE N-terminal-like domain-containing protein n=1 Tax=Rhodococcus opacus (strain B4) TaxID=632772 RepID=C1BCL6_RHOOB|nr:hypothetical protein ROP_pROB01-05720 [Rhodococcus opacus B4]